LPEKSFNILLLDFNPFTEPVTPISLGGVGAMAKAQGYGVSVVSLGTNSKFSPAAFRSYLQEYRPRLVGFGAYQRNMLHILGLARLIKSTLDDVKIVLGGPQATFMPDAAFLYSLPDIDYLSRGEGELTIVEIARALEEDDPDKPIPGVTSRSKAGEILTGPNPEEPQNLDDYPSPWLEGVLDPTEVTESIMLTSRGCPFNCKFCYTPAAFKRKIRAQSVERALEDIAWVANRGTGRLWFADPNFSFSRKRVDSMLEGILQRNLQVSMWVETRADMFDRTLARLMKRAGVSQVAFGLESASPAVYPALEKNIEPEKIAEAVALAFAEGLDVELFSQFGLPGETADDALSTLKFVKQCGVAVRGNSNAQQMQLYYGSEICDNYEDYGVQPLRRSYPPYLALGTEYETKWMPKADIELVKNAWRAESEDGGKRVVS
jgi:radical SAM superfamily enzyme YgiQ (UPF0313 family)